MNLTRKKIDFIARSTTPIGIYNESIDIKDQLPLISAKKILIEEQITKIKTMEICQLVSI